MHTLWIRLSTASLFLGLLGMPGLADAARPTYPATRKSEVTDEFHGTRVSESYRWLENGDDASVQAWTQAQNKLTRGYLDALPARKAILARARELDQNTSADYVQFKSAGGRLFALKNQPPKQQPYIVQVESLDDAGSARTVVDPNVLDKTGKTSMDFYVPSPDGRFIAVSLSKGGSESGDLHIFEVATGRELPDVIARINGGTAGGSVTWNADGSGLWYTRYPRPGERQGADLDFWQQVWFHRLGTPEGQDQYSIGREFPKIAEVELQSSPDGRYVLALVKNGDGGEEAHYLMGPAGTWQQISGFTDQISSPKFGQDGALYLLSRNQAPRGKVLRLPLERPFLSLATTVVPALEGGILEFLPTDHVLYVAEINGGPSRLRVFDLQGKELPLVNIPELASVEELARVKGDQVLYRVESYLAPAAWHRYTPGTGSARTAFLRTSSIHFDDYEVVREFADSKDGTRIPLNIIRRKGLKLDGNNPTLVYGYGGYGINLTPSFNPLLKAWLEQGGVYVVANIRGGGEYGDDWHRQGNLTRKQNVFDDFYAATQHMVKANYTRKEKLAIEGGSNGGLLMGATVTQHPEAMQAVVSHVGVYDMLRVELHPNGAFNVTEYGTVRNPDQFRALHDYSPYHHVKDGQAYPATLLLTGINDPRVDPSQSRKMAARMQDANAADTPILLRTTFGSGHGIGASREERLERYADVNAFLFKQLGMTYKPVVESPVRRGPRR